MQNKCPTKQKIHWVTYQPCWINRMCWTCRTRQTLMVLVLGMHSSKYKFVSPVNYRYIQVGAPPCRGTYRCERSKLMQTKQIKHLHTPHDVMRNLNLAICKELCFRPFATKRIPKWWYCKPGIANIMFFSFKWFPYAWIQNISQILYQPVILSSAKAAFGGRVVATTAGIKWGDGKTQWRSRWDPWDIRVIDIPLLGVSCFMGVPPNHPTCWSEFQQQISNSWPCHVLVGNHDFLQDAWLVLGNVRRFRLNMRNVMIDTMEI